MSVPLSQDRIPARGGLVNARPVTFVLLALALVLAPLGICAGGGMAMAAPAHASGMHHAPQPTTGHSGHGTPGKAHFCPECQPPTFVKAGKTVAPDVAPSSAAIMPIAFAVPFSPIEARATWSRAPSSRPPPLRRSYRIRLQI